ncbi:hypothetical protein SESBI_15295 [Sesbania bispinosa]|nr:hypothetical protein SESBI_15295 [Sesbania bispinosa]
MGLVRAGWDHDTMWVGRCGGWDRDSFGGRGKKEGLRSFHVWVGEEPRKRGKRGRGRDGVY